MAGTLRFAHHVRPHPEEPRSGVSKGWMAPAGPRGSRRRYAPPHHEGL